MKIKKWIAVTGAAALFSGMLLVGVPAAKALADPVNGQVGYGMQMGRTFGSMATSVAEFLGISQTDLVTARQSGKSMVQIAEENGKSQEQLVNFVVEKRSGQVAQLVEEGKITQAQADQHKQFVTERVKQNLNRSTVGPNQPDGNTGAGVGMGKGNRRGGGQGMGAGYGMGNGTCIYNTGFNSK